MHTLRELLEIEKAAGVGKARGLGRVLQGLTGSRARAMERELKGMDAVRARHAGHFSALPRKLHKSRGDAVAKMRAAERRKEHLTSALEKEKSHVKGTRVVGGVVGGLGALGLGGAAIGALADD